MLQRFRFFIPLAVAITGLSALIYATVQQNYRQNANDPQIQMSEDLAYSFAQGNDPKTLTPTINVNIAKSLYPFIILYDKSGKVILSNAQLNGKTPKLPDGVLSYTKQHGQDRITWEPENGVRIATVVTYYEATNSAGYVLAGRNMREVEKRESILHMHITIAWLFTLAATLIATLIFLPGKKN